MASDGEEVIVNPPGLGTLADGGGCTSSHWPGRNYDGISGKGWVGNGRGGLTGMGTVVERRKRRMEGVTWVMVVMVTVWRDCVGWAGRLEAEGWEKGRERGRRAYRVPRLVGGSVDVALFAHGGCGGGDRAGCGRESEEMSRQGVMRCLGRLRMASLIRKVFHHEI